jgi:hypothetical protein
MFAAAFPAGGRACSPRILGIGADSGHHEHRSPSMRAATDARGMTVDFPQINCPARAAAWAEHVEPRRPCDQRGPDRRRPQHVAAKRSAASDSSMGSQMHPTRLRRGLRWKSSYDFFGVGTGTPAIFIDRVQICSAGEVKRFPVISAEADIGGRRVAVDDAAELFALGIEDVEPPAPPLYTFPAVSTFMPSGPTEIADVQYTFGPRRCQRVKLLPNLR